MKTGHFYFAIALCFTQVSSAFAQTGYTHFTTEHPTQGGQVKKYTRTGPNEVLFTLGCEMISLQFSTSPSGKLMYLKRTEHFVDGKGGFRAFFDHERSPLAPPEPSIISLELHICDEEGNDLAVVPIPETCQNYYNYGEFLGEDTVRLFMWGRASGEIANLIVNLKTGALYGWGEDVGIAAFPSPDAERIACVIWRSDGNSLLAVNGAQIYPFRAERAPDASMTREEYRGVHESITAWLQEHPGLHRISKGGMEGKRRASSPWSPDGHHLVFFSLPADGKRPDERTTKTAEMIVFDVHRALDPNAPEDYMTRVQTDLPIVALYASYTRPVIQWPPALPVPPDGAGLAPSESVAPGERPAPPPVFHIKWQQEPDKIFRPNLSD